MSIETPPNINYLNNLSPFIYRVQKGTPPCLTDQDGRYSHWDKLHNSTPPDGFDDIEQYWLFIKLSRFTQYKKLEFIEDFVYVLTDDMQKNLHDIDAKMHGSIEAKSLANKGQYLRSQIDEAISSSQLEGATTTRKVAKEMLKSGRQPDDYSEQMIFNNHQAMRFIDQNKHNDLTADLVLELHKIITTNAINNPSDAGRLRQNNNIVVWDSRSQQVLHKPPDYQSLAERLKILCDFANGNTTDSFIHPIIRAIITHFILAFDHPFTDGNGRTARAIFYWVALKNNYWLSQYLSLSTSILETPSRYYESFLLVETDDFDLTYFIISQLKFINQSIQRLFTYMTYKQTQQQQALTLLSNFLADGTLNPRQAMIIQHAIKHSGAIYTIKTHQAAQNISQKSARDDLLSLAKLNLLHQSKQGKAFTFIAPADLKHRIKSYKQNE